MKVENKIVLVDDEKVNLEYHQRILSDFQTIAFLDASKALEYCTKNSFDILIADLKMPIMSGLDLIKEIKTVKDDFISILLTAYTETEYLVDAVNSNAIYQYLVKPCEPKRMIATVQKGFEAVLAKRKKQEEEIVLQEENLKLRKENTELRFSAKSPLEALVGFNPMILKIKEQIKSFSLSDHPVLISGEEGTGKDICAQAIHELSPRRDEQIITVNCSAIPENLLEEELFGTAPEANNLGVKEKKGFVRMAHKGTLYLENVEVLPSTFQAKLLRLLQYGSFFSQGATSEETVDIRMIFASRQNLYEMARSDEFRKDLFYQIANLHIKMPPLRERREDILPIMESIVSKKDAEFPNLDAKVKDLIVKYAYPGNIRELEAILEKLSIEARATGKKKVTVEMMESILKEDTQIYSMEQGDQAVLTTVHLPTGKEPIDMKKFVEEIESEIIMSALKFANYNISQTARYLSISRQGLKNKIQRYELPVDLDD